jgi:hypothetical protein
VWALRAVHVVANRPFIEYAVIYLVGTTLSTFGNVLYLRRPTRLAFHERFAAAAL